MKVSISLAFLATLSLLAQLVSSSSISFEGKSRNINLNFFQANKQAAQIQYTKEGAISFTKNGITLLKSNQGTLQWMVPASLAYSKIKNGLYHKSKLGEKYISQREWQLYFLDNFSSGNKRGWQGAGTQALQCGPSREKSLFFDCKSKVKYIVKKVKDLPKHSEVMVELNVHFLDQWEGEMAYLQINKDVVWTRAHNWCHTIFAHKCMKNGFNVCGRDYPDMIGHSVKFVYKHSGKDLVLKFGSNLKKDKCKATWGINNFMLYIR